MDPFDYLTMGVSTTKYYDWFPLCESEQSEGDILLGGFYEFLSN